MLTHGSLFAGIGGFDLGFERAGIKTVWQVEIDPFCRKVLEKHWPNVERFTDVRECGQSNLRTVDVICGGFPCQDVSAANSAGKGLDGERSGLWGEMRRIVCELRPRFVVVENVSNLLHRGIGRVLGELASIGYDAEWDCIPACALGAHHIRDRVWIIAYPARDLRRTSRHEGPEPSHRSDSLLADSEDRSGFDVRGIGGNISGAQNGTQGQSGHASKSSSNVADSESSKVGTRPGEVQARTEPQEPDGPGNSYAAYGGYWATEPDVGRVAHGIPARVDRLKGLGNAVVPQIAEWIGKRIIEVVAGESGRNPVESISENEADR